MEHFFNGLVTLHGGDAREVLRGFESNSFDSIVTDPPYALASIVKRFGKQGSAPAKGNEAFKRASAGFMGQTWDTGETAFSEEFWSECLRVLKPGGHLVAFSAAKTYHRMTCAIEDAGFEIRDQIQWLYNTGFPKSHDQGGGWGTMLKPAFEPIALSRKPLSEKTILANIERWGTGAIQIDGCRTEAGRFPANVCIPKASADERAGSGHPTVKPLDLMQWLIRLVTPRGGKVLDPFAGTGTTAEAAFREGMFCTLIEREPAYQGDIRRRMRLVMAGPDERRFELIKATDKTAANAGPLFEWIVEL